MDAEQITGVARGIGDLGMMAMAAGVFLLLAAGLMIACFKWFKALIDSLVTRNDTLLDELLAETRTQNEMLADLSEGLRPETLARVKVVASALFEHSKSQVCRMINTVRQENHIADRDATATKIRTLLHNLHEDRNSRFDNFSYRGHRLSYYTTTEWVEKIAQVFESELYNEAGENNGRAHTNVAMAYDDIKLDFYHRLNS